VRAFNGDVGFLTRKPMEQRGENPEGVLVDNGAEPLLVFLLFLLKFSLFYFVPTRMTHTICEGLRTSIKNCCSTLKRMLSKV